MGSIAWSHDFRAAERKALNECRGRFSERGTILRIASWKDFRWKRNREVVSSSQLEPKVLAFGDMERLP